jgi:hypothetical protein
VAVFGMNDDDVHGRTFIVEARTRLARTSKVVLVAVLVKSYCCPLSPFFVLMRQAEGRSAEQQR